MPGLAGGYSCGTARLWNWEGTCRLVLGRHSAAILGVCFSQGSTLVATASADGSVRVWTAADGACAAVLRAPAGERMTAVTFGAARTSHVVVTASTDGVARLYELPMRLLLGGAAGGAAGGGGGLSRHGSAPALPVFTAAPPSALAVSSAAPAAIFPAESKPASTFKGHSGAIHSLAIGESGEVLASAAKDGIRLWVLCPKGPAHGHARTLPGCEPVTSLAFASAGAASVASATLEGGIKVWGVPPTEQTPSKTKQENL